MARKPTTKPTPAKAERPKRVIPKKSETTASSSISSRRSSSPKTTKTASKKTSKKTDRKSKPTYERMVIKSLKDLGTRTFHSAIAICKYIEANYPVPEATFKRSVRLAIHKAVEDGKLSQHRASYRVYAKAIKDAKSSSSKSSSRSSSRSKPSSSSSSTDKKRKRSSTDKEEPKKRTTKNSAKTSDSIEKPKASKKSSSSSSKPSSSKSSKPSTSSKSSKSSSKRVGKRASSSDSSSSSSSAPPSVDKPSGLKSDHLWQYDDNGWKNYEVKASDVVEDVYQKYLANRGDTDVRAVKSGQWEYMVDFMAMKQTNIQHENHTTRSIRRIPISS